VIDESVGGNQWLTRVETITGKRGVSIAFGAIETDTGTQDDVAPA
jgi:hypothetical protein